MSAPREAQNVAMIGGVRFESDSGALDGPRGSGRLAPQPSQLLVYLLAHRGEVVGRPDIGAHLWPEGKIEVDQGIAFAVREIRKGLEAVGGDPGALETIPRRGYRLQSEVRASPAGAPGRRRRTLIGAGVLIALTLIGVLGRSGATPVIVIFEHAAGSVADALDDAPAETPAADLAANLAADLAAQLTTVLTAAFEDRVAVIGPTGAAVLDGPNDTEVARAELGACLVMSGSARTLGSPPDRLVVFTQIVRTRDRAHLWAAQDTLPLDGAVAGVLPRIVEGVHHALGGC